MIGRIEVESIIAEQGQVGVTCEFCNRSYTFDADDAMALFEGTGGVPAPAAPAPPGAPRH